MNNMKFTNYKLPKRILSLFLALLLALSTLAPTLAFAAEDALIVTNEAQIREALSGGNDVKIKMGANIVLNERIEIENGKTVEFDLDGHRLSRSLEKATGNGNIFIIDTQGKLRISDSDGITGRIFGGWTTGNGGAIENYGTLEISGGTIAANKATNGGAVYNAGSSFETSGGVFMGNTATGNGGAIYSKSWTFMQGGAISRNEATYGGGIYVESAECDVSEISIINNKATVNGGGVAAYSHTRVAYSDVTGNTAGENGGGIYFSCQDFLYLESISVENNRAKNGGGVSVETVSMPNFADFNTVTIKNNIAYEDGGGVQILGNVHFNVVTITDNIAGKRGGGTFVSNTNLYVYNHVVIKDNDVNGTENNCYLKRGYCLVSCVELTSSSKTNIGITYEDDTGTVVHDYKDNRDNNPLNYFFADVDKKRKSDCLTLLGGENVRYDITGFTEYSPRKDYVYRVTVKTLNDADGWNHAVLKFYTTDGYNGFGESELVKTIYFENEINDEGDQATLTFTSEHFLDKLQLYIDIGGGFTWRDWEGKVTVYINGVNTYGNNYKASSSPFSSSNKTWDLNVPEDKKPYPKKIFFRGENSEDIICNDASINDKIKTSKGKVFAYAMDQYYVHWRNPDISFSENNFGKVSEYTEDNNLYRFETIDDEEYYAIGRVLVSEGESQVDHTSKFTASYKTKNISHQNESASFNAQFKFLNTLKVIVRDDTIWSATGIEGTKVTLPDIENPTGYTITGFDKSAKGTLETVTQDGKEKMVYTFGDGDGVIEANCTRNQYTVVYDGNGATKGSMTPKTLTYDDGYYQLPTNGFTKTGYNFVGWNTEADGSGTAYENKQLVKNLASGQGDVVTLYAQWEEKTIMVTFKYPAEMGMEDEVHYVVYGSSITPEPFYDFGEEGHYEFISSNKKLTNIKSKVTATLTYEKKEHNLGEPKLIGYRCDKPGQKIYTCKDCGYEKTEEVPIGHRDVHTFEAYPATCINDGHETVIQCLNCGEILQNGNAIPATGHSWDYDNVEWSLATSEGEITGSATVSCLNDGEHKLSAPFTVTEQENGYLLEAEIEGRTVSKFLDLGKDIYTITVNSSGGGVATTEPTVAFPGEQVRILSTPETGKFLYQAILVEGSKETLLDDDTFTMPSRNVTVNALFADAAPNQCGPKAFWKVDEETKTLIFYGEGAMFDYGADSPYGNAPWNVNRNKCTHIRIEDGITSIGDNAFKEFRCYDDIDVYMGDTVKTIGEKAFLNVQDLTDIRFSKTLESIADEAFVGCEGLTKLYFPDTLKNVGSLVFVNDDMLAHIYCPADPTDMTWGDNTRGFYGSKQSKIHVSSDYCATYNSKFGNLVNAVFVSDDYYDVTLVQTEHGTISTDFDSAPLNTYVTVKAVPDEGYGIKRISATSTRTGSNAYIDSKNRFSMQYGGVTVTAEFAKYYAINSDNDDTEGTLTVPEKAMAGDTVTVNAVPADGFELENITVTDSKSRVIEVTDNTFVMPEDDVIVSPSYRKIGYDISYYSGEGGSVSGVTRAREGNDIELSITPETGYELDTLTVTDSDGNVIDVTDNTFMMPDSNVTVMATFKLLQFEIAFSVNGEVVQDEWLDYGTMPEFKGELSPYFDGDEEYVFTGWSQPITPAYSNTVYEAVYSKSGRINVKYLDENGEEKTALATPLTGEETTLDGGWYIADSNISYSDELKIAADTQIILADGKTMNIKKFGYVDANTTWTLSVYAQSGKTGTLFGSDASALMGADIYGGNVNLASVLADNLGIYGGNFESASLLVQNGEITLGCIDNNSTIKVNSYTGNTVKIAEGQSLTDGSKAYSGTLSAEDISSISGKTLRRAKTYSVDWVVNGELEESDENVVETSVPEYNGEIPAPYYDDENEYVFFGWSDGENEYAADSLPAVTADVVYTAIYSKEEHSFASPVWNWADDFSSASATFNCSTCDNTQTVDAEIQREDTRAATIYTATVQFCGETYTDENSIEKVLSDVTVNETTHGTVTANLNQAYEGEEVVLTVTPDESYILDVLSVKDANDNDITVTDGKFIMPASDVSVSATFMKVTYVEQVEPYIDENGAYITGSVKHFVGENGKNYAVKEDGTIGEELDSTVLSYFNFMLLEDGTYRITSYTGSTAITELVIPKTYDGKKITVIGSTKKNTSMVANGNTSGYQYKLVLNENITEITDFAFYAKWVYKVTGDTSGLKSIKRYAFSWANNAGNNEIELDLDYAGNIETGYCAFNNMKATFNIKHKTTFSFNTPNAQSIKYNFTDAHIFGEPVWNWAEDYSSATAEFTCTDSRCKHKETVNADITVKKENDKTIYTATAAVNGKTYTDVKEDVAENAFSITADDGIAINFYIDMPYYEAENGKVEVTYLETAEKKSAARKEVTKQDAELEKTDKGTRKLTFKCAPAQIGEDFVVKVYNAQGEMKEKFEASVEDYCNAMKNDATYGKLCSEILNYGQSANEYFNYADVHKAVYPDDNYSITTTDNYGIDLSGEEKETLTGKAVNEKNIGNVNIRGVSYVALLDPELRFYLDNSITEAQAAALAVSVESDMNLNARMISTSNGICVSVTGMKADEFGKSFTLKVGTTTMTYNGYAYLNAVLNNDSVSKDSKMYKLMRNVYRYAVAADEVF